ncbi:membrane protein [Klebsiella pneumoniae subsp. ozaenae]|uniref:Membrane protein n=1 Tax=Klebsiella pneumoniae subsp. ozaenae TaxID=574 RepID=A0A378BG18_KLEPO|nr:membrane protein [Klebsiella pneumoniae subsp. ozaenae]
MANWLHQLQSLLGQQGASPVRRVRQKGAALLPGAIGGLAGLLVASKSSRKLLAKYGTSALLAGGGAVAATVLWNKYQQKMRAQNTSALAPETAARRRDVDPRSVRLITALVFAAKSDGHIDDARAGEY